MSTLGPPCNEFGQNEQIICVNMSDSTVNKYAEIFVINVVNVIHNVSLWWVLTTCLATLMIFINDIYDKISFDASTIT